MIMKKKNRRIVVLGSGSFIAKSLINLLKLKNLKYLPIDRKIADFEKKNSVKKLGKIIKKKDIVIFIAAIAPVKNLDMLNKNLQICSNIIQVLKLKVPEHLIYVSSDAVYSDSKVKINEKSLTVPDSLHGFMHLIREKMLNQIECSKTYIRPTLVYGESDPHDGYGPNKFVRLAQKNLNINIFGNGEEKRDHIHVNNVAEILYYSIIKKYNGIINAVSGKVISFKQISKEIANTYPEVKVIKKKRLGPMPHNGYRAFNNTLIKKKFKKIKIVSLLDWIKLKKNYNV